MLNLYLLTQGSRKGYDTYDSAVVAAPEEDAARMIHPNGRKIWHSSGWRLPDCPHPGDTDNWPPPSKVRVTYLGPADKSVVGGVICASYNAG